MRKNIVAQETYTVNGEERVKWNQVGTIFTGKNEKEYVTLNHCPDVIFYVFEEKKKEERGSTVEEIDL